MRERTAYFTTSLLILSSCGAPVGEHTISQGDKAYYLNAIRCAASMNELTQRSLSRFDPDRDGSLADPKDLSAIRNVSGEAGVYFGIALESGKALGHQREKVEADFEAAKQSHEVRQFSGEEDLRQCREAYRVGPRRR